MNGKPRIIFFVSDSTGITVEKLGRSLLSQFPRLPVRTVFLRYLDSAEKVRRARARIEAAAGEGDLPPVVFSTLVDARLRAELATDKAVLLDMFEIFLGRLETVLRCKAEPAAGHAHRMPEPEIYLARMDAVNYALRNDDGQGNDYARAEVILLGVSRSGKTPVCLYLAMQHGIFAANYPLLEADLQGTELPAALRPFRRKLFGLTIEPQRLQLIRARRHSGRQYAQADQCRREVARAEELFALNRLPVLDTTAISVEEIATRIIAALGLRE